MTEFLPATVPPGHRGIFEPASLDEVIANRAAEAAAFAEKGEPAQPRDYRHEERLAYRGEERRLSALEYACRLAVAPSGADELIKRATVIADYLAGAHPERVV